MKLTISWFDRQSYNPSHPNTINLSFFSNLYLKTSGFELTKGSASMSPTARDKDKSLIL